MDSYIVLLPDYQRKTKQAEGLRLDESKAVGFVD
jgi:hypothetical protein